MGLLKTILQKLNPAQERIVIDQGESYRAAPVYTIASAYKKTEVVNRGVNLIVDSAAQIDIDIGNKISQTGIVSIRKGKLDKLLNYQPNPYIPIDVFLRNIYLDLLMDGNAFVYYDGAWLYNLPASNVEVVADKVTFISHYKYSDQTFMPDEIIHIRENSVTSIFRGESRLRSALDSITALSRMNAFQNSVFENHAIPGLVLKSPNVLSKKIKDRMIGDWLSSYTATRGGRRPMILDGDLQIDRLGSTDFRELDFLESVKNHETKILKALGVPPILLDAGNNANLMVNMKNFYISTVLPLCDKVIGAFERYFGYDLVAVKQNVLALRPDLKQEGAYLTALTNAGIMTRNEARESIRLAPKTDDASADQLIIPANIAGSAVDRNQGGAPAKGDDSDE